VLSIAKLLLKQRNTQKTKSKTKGEAPPSAGFFLYAVVAKSKNLPRHLVQENYKQLAKVGHVC
jgi:hypothetical protein